MAKNNNVIAEIQELIKQIKNEYQEGVDFRFPSGKNVLKNHGVSFIIIISPRLKKFFRERFNFPLGVVNHLDYVKMDHEGGDLLYRIHNHYKADVLSSTDGREGWIEKYFRDNSIYSITLDDDNLVIKYNDKNKKEEVLEAKKPELKLIKQIVAQQKDHSLTFSKSPQSANPSQPNSSNNNHYLVVGLALGAGAVILMGILVYFLRQRKKKLIS